MPQKKQSESEKLTNVIVEGILSRKGKNIMRLNMTRLPNAVTDYFILCHGTSDIQVKAIADAIIEETLKETGTKPWHKEGFENAEWILLDYVDVVVHIFKEETRTFYNLEKLWADAEIKTYSEN
ncbi:MAG: ribosome silencing factor [Bacteroidetes bacterium]|nr:ribosome silencing factor [Bacteroidota bacterium]